MAMAVCSEITPEIPLPPYGACWPHLRIGALWDEHKMWRIEVSPLDTFLEKFIFLATGDSFLLSLNLQPMLLSSSTSLLDANAMRRGNNSFKICSPSVFGSFATHKVASNHTNKAECLSEFGPQIIPECQANAGEPPSLMHVLIAFHRHSFGSCGTAVLAQDILLRPCVHVLNWADLPISSRVPVDFAPSRPEMRRHSKDKT